MSTSNKQPVFVFHGKKYALNKIGFIPIVDIDKYAKQIDLEKGKGCCVLGEVMIVVKQGTKYKLLGNPNKYLDDLKVAKPRSVFCVELVDLQPNAEDMVSRQSAILPPVPLQIKLGNAAEVILREADLLRSFEGCYTDKFDGISDPSRIISQIIGENAFNERSVRKRRENLKEAEKDNKDSRNVGLDTQDTEPKVTIFSPSVSPVLKNLFDKKARQTGGFNFDTVISLAPAEDQDKFVKTIEEKMSTDDFDNFFQSIQVKAKRRLNADLECHV